ncbi:hypothetical protein TrST_g7086 [Triparma strigata]|uniref:NADP-dependent oxidoreductase domain-containing protein n=1 Tax=Triparma strigata TaxID=1606541 RepID=A0A9W7AJX8_9STRA|nr:hypothetical protein TrST_g7086 [Triparma strigata]
MSQLPIALGTYQVKADDAYEAVIKGLQVGYRHIDTAQSYGNEEAIGRAITECIDNGVTTRNDLTVTTKLWPGSDERNFGKEKGYEETIETCKSSLKKMGLDYFDVYLIHGPFSSTRVHQYEALCKLKAEGFCKQIGVSNYGVDELEEIKHLDVPFVNQIEVSPICRQSAHLKEYMEERGIRVWAYGSLSLLSNWREGSRIGKESFSNSEITSMQNARKVVEAVSERSGKTMAQVLLRWALELNYSIVPKSTNEKRMRENLDVLSWSIVKEDMEVLNGLDMGMPMCWSFDPVGGGGVQTKK